VTPAEHKAASDVLLHASRHTEAEISETLNELLEELPESPDNEELRELVLHRWRHSSAVGAEAFAKLLVATKPTS
jgi:hypothetical protein